MLRGTIISYFSGDLLFLNYLAVMQEGSTDFWRDLLGFFFGPFADQIFSEAPTLPQPKGWNIYHFCQPVNFCFTQAQITGDILYSQDVNIFSLVRTDGVLGAYAASAYSPSTAFVVFMSVIHSLKSNRKAIK
jgi:hypothetical protein